MHLSKLKLKKEVTEQWPTFTSTTAVLSTEVATSFVIYKNRLFGKGSTSMIMMGVGGGSASIKAQTTPICRLVH